MLFFAISLFLLARVPENLAFSSPPPSSSSSTPAPAIRQLPIGRINTLDRRKGDNALDSEMYSAPRFVTHTDDAFLRKLTDLYRKVLPDDNNEVVILDLMSSHVSHLPDDVQTKIKRVDVHGMNQEELESNPVRRATGGRVLVRDLNANPSLVGLCHTGEYDAVLCCVGVQES